MGLLVGALLTLLSIPFSRSKLYTQIFLIYLWILWGWNYYNGDYEPYEESYNNIIEAVISDYEIGYKLLMLTGNAIGLSFQGFYQIISFFVLVLWDRIIIKESKYPALFTALIFWVYFPLDYVLIRNTLAFAIVMQGLCLLIHDIRHKRLKFFTIVLLACTIHSSSVFYFSFLLLPYLNKISEKKIIAVIILLIFLGVFFNSFLTQQMDENFENRTEIYNSSIITFTIYSSFEIFNCFLLRKVYYKTLNISEHSNIFLIIYHTSLLLLLLIPTFSIVAITIRIFRNVTMIYLLYLVNILRYRKCAKLALSIIIIYCLVFVLHFIVPVYQDSIFPLFNNNLLLR